jgi:hypothetical protein
MLPTSMSFYDTGVGDIDPETCTEMLLNELIQFCHTRSGDKLTIHIVINDEVVADSVKDVFTKTIDDKMNASHKPEKLDEDEFVKSKLKNEASGGEVHESHDQVSNNFHFLLFFILKMVTKIVEICIF